MTTYEATPAPAEVTPGSRVHTILLATDGTGYAEETLHEAIQMVKRCHGRLVITYYADPNDTSLYDGFPCYNEAEWQAYGRRVLDRLESKARAAGLDQVETYLENYQEEKSLAELAEQFGAGTVMLGSHMFHIN